MTFTSTLLLHLAQAAGLGLSVALLLWLLRRYSVVRRVRVALLLAALLTSLYLLVYGSGLPGEAIFDKIAVAGVLMLATYTLLQLIDLLLWDYLVGRRRHVLVPRLIVDVFNFVVMLAVALVVLNQVFAVELTALLVTSTVLSAVIGLSLQDVLGNVVAGLALQMESPYDVGDWVQVTGQEGEVIQMNWRTLTIRTRDNHYVIVPNANVSRHEIVNYSRPTPLQAMHARVGLAYQHAPGQVKELLARTVAGVPEVQSAPQPEARVLEYGDFAVLYDIKYYIVNYARHEEIHDALMTRLWYELGRAGLSIPYPVRDVTVRTLTEDHETRQRQALHRALVGVLRRLALFAPLSDEEIDQLAINARLQRFTAGEMLVRQGETGDSLFVIKSGRVHIDMRRESGEVVRLRTLGPDEFFGEMSLLTGARRSASAVAEVETEVVVVDKAAFAEVLVADTGILEALSEKLEARVREAVELDLLPAAAAGTPAPRARAIEQIKRFFGIG